MRGRKKTPTILTLVRGNPSRKPVNRDEPVAEGDLQDPPDWLTERQKEGWRYAVAHAPRGLLRLADRQLLTIWIVAEDLHREAAQQVARFGAVTSAPHSGSEIQTQHVAVMNKQAEIMMRAASELGFSPTSRARISVKPKAQTEPGNRFANNGTRPA